MVGRNNLAHASYQLLQFPLNRKAPTLRAKRNYKTAVMGSGKKRSLPQILSPAGNPLIELLRRTGDRINDDMGFEFVKPNLPHRSCGGL